jgi:transcriptional/translational regulatory protein YebC/TACO1
MDYNSDWHKYFCSAKQGGVNPASNVALQQILEQAKKANVPKDIIDRNLKRAQDKDTATLTEVTIELYGPGGTGYILECLTDNKQRAATDIWTVVKKLDGKVWQTSLA